MEPAGETDACCTASVELGGDRNPGEATAALGLRFVVMCAAAAVKNVAVAAAEVRGDGKGGGETKQKSPRNSILLMRSQAAALAAVAKRQFT